MPRKNRRQRRKRRKGRRRRRMIRPCGDDWFGQPAAKRQTSGASDDSVMLLVVLLQKKLRICLLTATEKRYSRLWTNSHLSLSRERPLAGKAPACLAFSWRGIPPSQWRSACRASFQLKAWRSVSPPSLARALAKETATAPAGTSSSPLSTSDRWSMHLSNAFCQHASTLLTYVRTIGSAFGFRTSGLSVNTGTPSY